MQKLLGLLVLGLVCTLGLTTSGCKKKDETTNKGGDGTKGGGGETVEYIYPTEVLVLKQGSKTEAELRRKGKTLKEQPLTITSSDPKVTIKGGEKFGDKEEMTTVTIHAAKDAPAKEHTITVKAGDVEKTFKVRVEKGDGEVAPPADKGAGKVEDKGAGKGDKGAGKVEDKGAGKGEDKGAGKGDKGAGKGDKGAMLAPSRRNDTLVAHLAVEARRLDRPERLWASRES